FFPLRPPSLVLTTVPYTTLFRSDMYTGADYRRALETIMADQPSQSEVVFLYAERDLVASEPGLYPPDLVADYARQWPHLSVIDVQGTNHFDILLTETGIDTCAEAVTSRLGAVVDGAVE